MARNIGWFTRGMGPGVGNLYKSGFTLHVTHVPTGHTVEFPAFITDHSDAFTSNWTEETVFGRMDPIATFESTKRVASLGFTVPSRSRHDALHNLGQINTLLSFLYPTYADVPGATVMNMGPLVRVKYANLICSTENPSKGLLGYITTGITVTPDMEAGVFGRASGTPDKPEKRREISGDDASFRRALDDRNLNAHGSGISGPEILYKSYNLNFELSVLHEHSLGFTKVPTKKGESFVFRNKKGRFPYNTGTHITPNRILNRGEAEVVQPTQNNASNFPNLTPEERKLLLDASRNDDNLTAAMSKYLSPGQTPLSKEEMDLIADYLSKSQQGRSE